MKMLENNPLYIVFCIHFSLSVNIVQAKDTNYGYRSVDNYLMFYSVLYYS